MDALLVKIRFQMTNPEWTSRGESVAQRIRELHTFEDQEMEVRISLDNGDTSLPISLIGKSNDKFALLMNCQDETTPIRHQDEF